MKGRKHRPKHVELTWDNKFLTIYIVQVYFIPHTCREQFGITLLQDTTRHQLE